MTIIKNPQDTTSMTQDKGRQKWLIDTLYALRGHFNDNTPTAAADLRNKPSGKEGILWHCIDGRVDEAADLNLTRGQYYNVSALGAGITPPGRGKNMAMTALLRRGLLPDNDAHLAPPKTAIILGHESCGANATLLDRELAPHQPSARPEEAELMHPMAPGTLAKALRAARFVPHEKLHDEVIRSTVLNSMKNLYGYKAGDVPMKDLIDSGQAQIVGAIRGLVREDGKFPLTVYDPQVKDFVPIEALYDQAFPHNNERSSQAIEARMQEHLKSGRVVFSSDRPLVVVQGATMGEKDITAGISAQLNRLKSMGAAATPPM